VVTIAPGSPAETSGLLLGDIIVAIEGSPVHGVRSLQPSLDTENIGKSVVLEIVRGGRLLKQPITIGERQES
jgi:S1-C subfamily serine protease